MFDEVLITKLMKHVSLMATELLNLLAWTEFTVADTALRPVLRFAKSSCNCLAEGMACPLDSRLVKVCLKLGYHDRALCLTHN